MTRQRKYWCKWVLGAVLLAGSPVFLAESVLAQSSLFDTRVQDDEVATPTRLVPRVRTVVEYVQATITPEERRATESYHRAVAQLKNATNNEQREAIRRQLIQLFNQQFERDLQERRKKVDQLDARVQNLRDEVNRRQKAKGKIIDLQVRLIVNEANGLGFPKFATPQSINGTLRVRDGGKVLLGGSPYSETESLPGPGKARRPNDREFEDFLPPTDPIGQQPSRFRDESVPEPKPVRRPSALDPVESSRDPALNEAPSRNHPTIRESPVSPDDTPRLFRDPLRTIRGREVGNPVSPEQKNVPTFDSKTPSESRISSPDRVFDSRAEDDLGPLTLPNEPARREQPGELSSPRPSEPARRDQPDTIKLPDAGERSSPRPSEPARREQPDTIRLPDAEDPSPTEFLPNKPVDRVQPGTTTGDTESLPTNENLDHPVRDDTSIDSSSKYVPAGSPGDWPLVFVSLNMSNDVAADMTGILVSDDGLVLTAHPPYNEIPTTRVHHVWIGPAKFKAEVIDANVKQRYCLLRVDAVEVQETLGERFRSFTINPSKVPKSSEIRLDPPFSFCKRP